MSAPETQVYDGDSYDNGPTGKDEAEFEIDMSGPPDKDEVKEYDAKAKQHTASRGRDDPDSRYGES